MNTTGQLGDVQAAERTVITCGQLIDGNGGTPLSEATLLLAGERVAEVLKGPPQNRSSRARQPSLTPVNRR